MAKPRRGSTYLSEESRYLFPGFSDKDSGPSSPTLGEGRGLTQQQEALRRALLEESADEAARIFDSGAFSIEDGIEVALDSLARSNMIVDDILHQSHSSRQEFERRSRRIDVRLRENGDKLAELVGR